MLGVLAVFIPSFFMTGPAQSLFLPLSLAVGFAMGASYLLSSSLVPVLANWMLKQEKSEAEQPKLSVRRKNDSIVFANASSASSSESWNFPSCCSAIYAVVALFIVGVLGPALAEEIFPSSRIDAIPPSN